MSTQCMGQHVQELKNGRRAHKDALSSSRILGVSPHMTAQDCPH